MALSAAIVSQTQFPRISPFSQPPVIQNRHYVLHHLPILRAVKAAAEPEKSNPTTPTKTAEEISPAPAAQPTVKIPKKPVYSMKKGQIVRVEKEKYLDSVNYLSVGHPKFYKGLDYIYEDRGEVLDLRIFETGEYALKGPLFEALADTLQKCMYAAAAIIFGFVVAWVGVPTAPAWLPTDMLIKSDKLDYERL